MNIEDIREICLKQPKATEDVKWGHDLAFSIAEKMFCVVGLSETPTSASFKVKEDEFEDVCARTGFIPAPYMARHKWVMIEDVNLMSKKEWQHYIAQSYQLVFEKLPAKKKKEIQG